MKICVDKNKCIGCGACVAEYKEIFTFVEGGFAGVISDKKPEDIDNMLRICPMEAIYIDNTCEDSCKCENDCGCENDCKCDNCNCDK